MVTLCDAVEPLDWLNGTDDKCITLLAVVATVCSYNRWQVAVSVAFPVLVPQLGSV